MRPPWLHTISTGADVVPWLHKVEPIARMDDLQNLELIEKLCCDLQTGIFQQLLKNTVIY